jgi:hypothetical protein
MQAAEGLYREYDLGFVGEAVAYATVNDLLKKSYP